MPNIALIRQEADHAKPVIAAHMTQAMMFVVKDEATCALAEYKIKEIKAYHAGLKGKLAEWINPLKQSIEVATSDVKPRLDALMQIEKILKKKCVDYRSNMLRLREEAERAAQAAIDAGDERQAAEALERAGNLAAPKTKGVHYKTVVIATVVDPDKVTVRPPAP
jgi:hypothetical protein